ncbi:Glutamyl-Q tRNA(Asp) synthetase [Bosea sp. 62]|uniref:tRNA glutamyl-Q(34) synthetase GluQRS n=1 Tax=unclassified Bosea (in: a-proteobacteria) TaxID=2653178 RepID=UPI001257C16E|nr:MULTISPECIES: tRNA glutamyl-Q(34) synthetase GluQRS [unclassified Bosea (in: a-proteobacteria)]CAD5249770.1 Glutamyl-Q tRNA(Asp) synthetase [Bosea sp. 7B]CAD5282708.1 Glutamyl-Q tRNA(Asp) synthetase [Bosea sp. 21B]CAD5285322.1 Glutamyl-Q tRNA(Asp) synthetase [Bosea sp. 46]VVT62273.1 Glutamyl-Q tRNA(Asp) synthetase [Bosea sp. EC-HK365B]VXB20950.1 Glutamyl-Q tRNA(Asp) synthetase [Bosea sp. 62]
MAPSSPIFRFAPSPNGRLHLGHAYSALLNEQLAACSAGELLLRIEDIDLTRCRPEFEQGIRDDLAWLGVSFAPVVRRQSRHFDDYRRALDRLDAMGLIYPCFCSRQRVKGAVGRCEAESGTPWPRDPDGAPLYPGTCRDLNEAEARRRREAGEPHVLRLAMDRALARMAGEALVYRLFDETGAQRDVTVDPAGWGDVVLARKDVPTSYHLSVVVDDALQDVSHVVRGMDLEAATGIHVLLQRLLGLPTPHYHFHRLLSDETGQKLAKSRLSRSLADLRADGVTPEAIRCQLGFT